MAGREILRKLVKMARIARHAGALRGLRLGVAAAVEHADMLANLEFATLVDVGANVGQFSLIASSMHPRARIIAFEPLSRPAGVYQKLFAGNPLVRLERFAIGAHARRETFHISGQDDSSSLLEISDTQVSLHPGTAETGRIEVEVRPLSGVLTAADLVGPVLLKMDVQGFELEVLRGCEGLLDRIDHIYAEVSFMELYKGQPLAPEIVSYLAARSFELAGVYNIAADSRGRTIQTDFLFSRRPA